MSGSGDRHSPAPAVLNDASKRAGFFLKPVPLSEFTFYLVGLLFVQYWAGFAAMLLSHLSAETLANEFAQVSVLPVIEWYMLFGFIRRVGNRPISPALAYGSLALIVAASVGVHHQRIAFLVETLALLAAWIAVPGLRRVGAILLMIALQHPQWLTPLHGLISGFDAQTVSGVMSLIGHPVTRTGNMIISAGMPDGMIVLAGCASSNLMVPMGLGLAVLLVASRDRLTGADFGWIGITLAIAFAINIVRLCLMLQSHAAYLSWHIGTGASYVSVGGLIVTLAAWFAATGRDEARA